MKFSGNGSTFRSRADRSSGALKAEVRGLESSLAAAKRLHIQHTKLLTKEADLLPASEWHHVKIRRAEQVPGLPYWAFCRQTDCEHGETCPGKLESGFLGQGKRRRARTTIAQISYRESAEWDLLSSGAANFAVPEGGA